MNGIKNQDRDALDLKLPTALPFPKAQPIRHEQREARTVKAQPVKKARAKDAVKAKARARKKGKAKVREKVSHAQIC